MMNSLQRLCFLLLIGVLSTSASCSSAPTPGYEGAAPSPMAQQILRGLRGEELTDRFGVFGGGTWTIASFAVIPNPVSAGGKGPVLRIEQGTKIQYVPVETDGDVADLYYQIHRRQHPVGLDEETSAAYTAAWRERRE